MAARAEVTAQLGKASDKAGLEFFGPSERGVLHLYEIMLGEVKDDVGSLLAAGRHWGMRDYNTRC